MTTTKQIKNILVAVDFSEYSKTVAMQARTLASKLKIPLTFVYVFQDAEMFKSQFSVRKIEVVKHYTVLLRKKYDISTDTKVQVKFGKIYKQIIAAAKKIESPLIVAGCCGSHPLARFFVGSTAENLALESPYPVWIHRGENVFFPKNILIPCDLSERSHRAVILVDPLLKLFNASSELFHVEQDPMPILDYESYAALSAEIKKDEIKKLKQFRKRHPNLKVTTTSGGIVDCIQHKSKTFDLIAMTPKASLKSKPFFGSVSSKIVRNGEVSILIVR